MSYLSDRDAVVALCELSFKQDCVISVGLTDGSLVLGGSVDSTAIFDAVSGIDDVILLTLRRHGDVVGKFSLLLQGDPDCVVVDHSAGPFCSAIFYRWSPDEA